MNAPYSLATGEVCEGHSIVKGELKKIKVKKRKWPAGGINPATFFCEQSGGRARTFYYKNKDEVSICEYSDKSYLKTWTAIKQFSKR